MEANKNENDFLDLISPEGTLVCSKEELIAFLDRERPYTKEYCDTGNYYGTSCDLPERIYNIEKLPDTYEFRLGHTENVGNGDHQSQYYTRFERKKLVTLGEYKAFLQAAKAYLPEEELEAEDAEKAASCLK